MEQLEKLLNSLIKIGWKPWNVDVNCDISIKIENNRIKIYFELKTGVIVSNSGGMSLRELVSLESGLWRFVCMHSLISEKADMRDYREDSFGFKSKPIDPDGEYRIIRSALVPEEELGQFLIDNIKTE